MNRRFIPSKSKIRTGKEIVALRKDRSLDVIESAKKIVNIAIKNQSALLFSLDLAAIAISMQKHI